MEFNKKYYNSNLHIQFDFVIFYFDVYIYIYIYIDFIFRVQMHVQQFESICKPQISFLCYIENDDAINCTIKFPNTY
jgi:hypothetical protein